MFARSIVSDMHGTRHAFDQRYSTLGDVRVPGDVFSPPVETGWTDNAYHLRIILPGVPERQVRTTVQGNQLLVTGERWLPAGFANESCASLYLPYGRFEKLIDLPSGLNTDKLTARLRDGILHVTVPLRDPLKPRPVYLEVALPEEWELAAATV